MKSIYLSLVLATCSLSIVAQSSKMKVVTVSDQLVQLDVSFSPLVEEEHFDEMNISISPVDPLELNDYYRSQNIGTGWLHYKSRKIDDETYILKRRKRKTVEMTVNQKLELGIQTILDSGLISEAEAQLFLKAMSTKSNKIKSGLYVTTEEISYNPYYFKPDQFLSVFKIEITNNSNSPKVFLNDFIVQNGDVTTSTLQSLELEGLLSNSSLLTSEKSEIIRKFNLESKTIVPPKTTVTKFFATYPLRYRVHKEVAVYSPTLNKSFNWVATASYDSFQKEIDFYELDIDLLGRDGLNINGKYLGVMHAKHSPVFMFGNSILFQVEEVINPIEIIYVGLSNNDHDFYFKRLEFIPSEYFNFSKRKKKDVQLKMDRLLKGLD